MNLEEIRARADAATRGPWHVEYFGDAGYPQRVANDAGVIVADLHEGGGYPARNAEFIARARTDVPDLLDALHSLNLTFIACDAARMDQAHEAEKLANLLAAVRRLCQSYTPEPPPLFRGPGLSEHGEGYNHGTRDMAAAVLGVLDGEEES